MLLRGAEYCPTSPYDAWYWALPCCYAVHTVLTYAMLLRSIGYAATRRGVLTYAVVLRDAYGTELRYGATQAASLEAAIRPLEWEVTVERKGRAWLGVGVAVRCYATFRILLRHPTVSSYAPCPVLLRVELVGLLEGATPPVLGSYALFPMVLRTLRYAPYASPLFSYACSW